MKALNYKSKFNCNFLRGLFWHIILSVYLLLMYEALFTKVSEVGLLCKIVIFKQSRVMEKKLIEFNLECLNYAWAWPLT